MLNEMLTRETMLMQLGSPLKLWLRLFEWASRPMSANPVEAYNRYALWHYAHFLEPPASLGAFLFETRNGK